MHKKYFHLITTVILFSVLACNKSDKGYQNAVVVDRGDISNLGCGYTLKFDDGREEKPYQLLSAYQHGGMNVKVKYHTSDVLDTCGATQPYFYYKLIIIDDIKKGSQ